MSRQRGGVHSIDLPGPLPSRLVDPEVYVMAAHRGGERVAGAILNRSSSGDGPVVGLSNVHTDDDPVPVYASLADAVQARGGRAAGLEMPSVA